MGWNISAAFELSYIRLRTWGAKLERVKSGSRPFPPSLRRHPSRRHPSPLQLRWSSPRQQRTPIDCLIPYMGIKARLSTCQYSRTAPQCKLALILLHSVIQSDFTIANPLQRRDQIGSVHKPVIGRVSTNYTSRTPLSELYDQFPSFGWEYSHMVIACAASPTSVTRPRFWLGQCVSSQSPNLISYGTASSGTPCTASLSGDTNDSTRCFMADTRPAESAGTSSATGSCSTHVTASWIL